MSNSIWKTPDQKPEPGRQVLEHWKNCYGEDKYAVWITDGERGFDSHTIRWCYCEYVDDLIAQADKAERLQKAVDLIANMEQRLCIDDPVDILDDILKIAKDEIKQLIKDE